jgi:tetratricopeptide (TPR) repeat protein
MAQAYWISGNLDSAETILNSLITRADNVYRARIYSYLASLYFYQGKIKKATNYAKLGIEICRSENKQEDEAYFNYLLSEIYRNQSNKNKQYYYTTKAVELSQNPYWEIGLSAISNAIDEDHIRAKKLLSLMEDSENMDPIFKKRWPDWINFIEALKLSAEDNAENALIHLQQIKKHYSGDPIYWLNLREKAAIKLMNGDTTGLDDYRIIINNKGEIIMSFLGGVRRAGFWTSRLIPEMYAELGKHYHKTGDIQKANTYLRLAREIWKNADKDYNRAQEIWDLLN